MESIRTTEGETKIFNQGIEITIPPHLPLITKRLKVQQLKDIAAFCKKNSREKRTSDSPSHTRIATVIQNSGKLIYQSLFLKEIKDDEISSFSEVKVNGGRIDCVLLGPFGLILIEVKPTGAPGQKQLEKYQEQWQKQLPNISSWALRASYKGNKKAVVNLEVPEV